MERLRRSPTALRSVVFGLTILPLVTACDERNELPTAPVVAPRSPAGAILGADVTGVPFAVAAINESGQVAGTQESGGTSRAVRWTPGGVVQDLGTLGGASSWAYAINESGQVAGASITAAGDRLAFLWTPGQGMRDLGTLPGALSSTARGINDLGQVVGESKFPRTGPPEPQTHAFLWSSGEGMQDLGALGQGLTSSVAYDINNAGQVVGRSFLAQLIPPPIDPEYNSRAFLWVPGQGMRDLGDLGGKFSVAYAINDAGQVVGKSWLSTGDPAYGIYFRAFLWTSDQGMRSLGELWDGPSTNAAYGINEAGQVVGESNLGIAYRAGFPFHGFLWSASEGMEALSPTTGIHAARGINDRQQVIGDGRVATLLLAPGNSPPAAVTGGPYSATEGAAVLLYLSGADNDDVGFVFKISFGDGSADWSDINPASNHLYADDGTYTLTLTVRDRRGATDTKSTTVSIANVAPTILAGSLTGPTAPIQLTAGSVSAPIVFEFTDPAGTSDVYTAEIACGNGVVRTATDIPVSSTYSGSTYTGGRGTYAGSCTYTRAGVYTVAATVSDDDGGVSTSAFYRYVVVYDPAGASATGSGFYAVGEPTGKGNRAHFTFNAKFLPGQTTTPNGTAKFWIPGGQLNFESTTIEMLVASGNGAQFWGSGTLNGATARFRITALDGKLPGPNGIMDAFRIELWQAGTLVFDTQPGAAQDAPVATEIDGGNIRIRRE